MQTGATIQELFPTFVLGLDELEVEVLADLVEPRRVPADAQVITYGQRADELWVVLDGALHVSTPPDIDLGVKGRREWVGDLGFIQPAPAPVGVRAWGDVEALVLTQGALRQLWSHPRVVGHLWRALARTLAARIRACAALGQVDGSSKARTLQRALATLHGMPPVHEPSTWTPSTTPAPAHGRVDVAAARDRLARTLGSVEVFEPLDRDLQTLLARAAVFEAYEPGERILRAGHSRDRLYLVLSGRVTLTLPQHLGEYDGERHLRAGAMFGQLSFVDGGPRCSTCTAVEPTVVAAWHFAMIEELLRLGADGRVAAVNFLYWVTRQIARDARRVGSLLEEALRRIR